MGGKVLLSKLHDKYGHNIPKIVIWSAVNINMAIYITDCFQGNKLAKCSGLTSANNCAWERRA
jgi:hypothetical protein